MPPYRTIPSNEEPIIASKISRIKYLNQLIKRESMSNPSRFIITKPTPPQLLEPLPSQLWYFPLGKFPKNGLFSQ